MDKWRYSAFRKSNLAGLMREKGRDQLIITGIYAHIGCMMTAAEAFMQDIQAFMVADALADFSLDNHTMAIAYAAGRCAVVLTTEQALAQLELAAAVPVSGPFSIDALRGQVAGLLLEEPSSLGDSDHLLEVHGLDSIRMMSLIEAWRGQGAEATFVELAEQPTLASWSVLLQARTAAGANV